MKRVTSTLLLALVGWTAVTSCGSDGAEVDSSDSVVAGAPLTMVAPVLETDVDGSAVILGTLSNVSDRTVEVVSATSSVGDVVFRSGTNEDASLVIEPRGDLILDLTGTHLSIPTAGSDVDVVEVTLLLDIDDQFVFEAERSAVPAADGGG